MNITKYIIDLIKDLNVPNDIKTYWINLAPKLSENELKKIYNAVTAKSIEELDKMEKSEIEYQKVLKRKLEEIPNIINKYFKDFEEKTRHDENPDALLLYL